jgi:DNA-binding transcriptional LysR family regulator
VQDIRFDDPSGGVRDGTTDVAITWTPLDESGLDVEQLTEEPRRIILSRDHRLADAPQITVEDVLGEPFPVSDSTDPVSERFWTLAEERGGPPDPAVRITSQDELLVGARSGRLIAAMPQALVHQIPFDDIVAREVEGLRPAGVATCRLAGNDNPLVEAFVQAVRQAAGR